ncbi:MAG: universal stress protein [Akkermansiaceae bacterium]|nr:universal stress protein [Armatimonadota bacterium]
MYKKIIVCVDDTPLSEHATLIGADLARRYGASVVLLSVVDPARIAGKTFSGLEAAQMIEQQSRILTNSTHRLGVILTRIGVRNSEVVLPGRSVETILKVAETESADLLVVGSEPRGRLRAWLNDDLWSALSHKATCSVLRVTSSSPIEGYDLDGDHGSAMTRAGSEKSLMTVPLSAL